MFRYNTKFTPRVKAINEIFRDRLFSQKKSSSGIRIAVIEHPNGFAPRDVPPRLLAPSLAGSDVQAERLARSWISTMGNVEAPVHVVHFFCLTFFC